MAISRGDKSDTELFVHLNDELINNVLLWNIIPLQFAIPAVTKNAHHFTGCLPHSLKDCLITCFAIFPVVTRIHAAEASRSSDNSLTILRKEIVVHARIAIEVFALIALRNQLKDVLKSCLILCEEDKMTATAQYILDFLTGVFILYSSATQLRTESFSTLLVLKGFLILLTPLCNRRNKICFRSEDGLKVLTLFFHLLGVEHLMRKTVCVTMIG